MKNVLLVCHANTCRSVMAHVLLEQMLDERRARERVVVRSGGIANHARDGMVSQPDYLQAVIGNAKYAKTCPSIYICGGPFETAAGAPKQDLEKAKQLLKESGYDGRPIVILDPTDSPFAHAPALVTAESLKKIGANVDIQAMSVPMPT